MPRIEPGAAGQEARMLPLCYAAPPPPPPSKAVLLIALVKFKLTCNDAGTVRVVRLVIIKATEAVTF